MSFNLILTLEKSLTKIQTKSPRTGEEVIKYFACGGENRFFYLKLDPTSPCYDPYKLVIFSESAPQPPAPPPSKEFYTISAFGVVRHFPDGTTESSSLVAWQREATLFRGLKMLPFFGRFSLLKAIRRWKRVTALIRQEKVREFLQENLLLQVSAVIPSVMNLLSTPVLSGPVLPATPQLSLPMAPEAGRRGALPSQSRSPALHRVRGRQDPRVQETRAERSEAALRAGLRAAGATVLLAATGALLLRAEHRAGGREGRGLQGSSTQHSVPRAAQADAAESPRAHGGQAHSQALLFPRLLPALST